jgi:hypothetical protein
MARRKFLVWKGFDILGAVERNQCFFPVWRNQCFCFWWSGIRIKWSGKWSHGRASLIQLISLWKLLCFFWGCRVVGFESLKMDRTLSPLHDFGVKNGIRFFLVPTKLMVFLLFCHHDVSLLFWNSWFVLFLLFCGLFVMTTHKIEVQVMISVKLDHCYFQLDFGPCRVDRSS